MSRLLTPNEVCERSLRKIGTFPITDTGADPEEMKEARFWLDMMIAHQVGTNSVFWLVPQTLTLTLVAGQQEYTVKGNAAPASATADGIEFVTDAWLVDSDGNRTPLRLVTRSEWESLPDRQRDGAPEVIYLDRLLDGPKLRTSPVIASDETDTFTIELVLQTYSQDFTRDNGREAMKMRAAWNLWCVTNLSYYIGSGPVRRLPKGETDDMKRDADKLWKDLFAFENREHETLTLVQPQEF